LSANNKILIGLQKTHYITSPKPLSEIRGRKGRQEGKVNGGENWEGIRDR